MAVVVVLLGALIAAAPALAEEAFTTPHWTLESRAAPTHLPPKHDGVPGEGLIAAVAANIGDAPANGEHRTITITDTLPPEIEATKVEAEHKNDPHEANEKFTCEIPQPHEVTCAFGESLLPYEELELLISVKVTDESASAQLDNEVTVAGGEGPDGELLSAPPALVKPIAVSAEEPQFGVEKFELVPEGQDFKPDTQAGSQPFQLTTTFDLNQKDETLTLGGGSLGASAPLTLPAAPALTKELSFKLPPGLIGDPKAVPECSGVQFGANAEGDINVCPNDTVVGVATVTLLDPIQPIGYRSVTVPLFNLVPAPGEPARFGFASFHVPVVLNTSVRTGEDYGVTVTVHEASEAVQVLGSRVTFWGDPGDPRHNRSRGWACFGWGPTTESCGTELPQPSTPFLSLPTASGPKYKLATTVQGEAWNGGELEAKKEPHTLEASSESSLELQESEQLPFGPSLEVKPDEHTTSTPTGLTVEVNVPQEAMLTPGGLSEADIRETVLELPPEMQASAGAANGLETCGVEQSGFDGLDTDTGATLTGELEEQRFSALAAGEREKEATCPKEAKIGTVEIVTPVLAHPIKGAVYIAHQDTNPFVSPLVLYVIAEEEESKVLVKLAGEVEINQATGQLVSRFKNTPQAPFEKLTLHLFNTGTAAQATPARCGPATATATFTPWSDGAPLGASSNPHSEGGFDITGGPNGIPCPTGATLPFEPSFEAGSTNPQAGAFTPFTLAIKRPDGSQPLTSLTTVLPPGLAAILASVTPCQEPQAANGECGEQSLIGHSSTSSGLGGAPYTLPGDVYLTGPYDGAPFGLSAVTSLEHVGPFDVGKVVVRSSIAINESTAAATIDTAATRFIPAPGGGAVQEFPGLPELIKGVPAQIKQLNVTIDRPGFEFNPTNCDRMEVSGTMTGGEGTVEPVSSPFYASNCASLPFKPELTATVAGQGSKADGTTFIVTVKSPGLGQANIHKVDLTIPASLPSRLETLQQACREKVFAANPASCDEGSVIGEGIVHTPVFKNPLRGPAYLVSHGNRAFPDVEFVLQGEGVTIVLDGNTDIVEGVTYSKFETAPDAPFTTFESIFPAGPHGVLTPHVAESEHYNLCKTSLSLPTEITGQNGAFISQDTKVQVTGCAGVKSFKATKAQLLAKALKACKKDKKKSKRVACERAARKKYGAKAKKPAKKSSRRK